MYQNFLTIFSYRAKNLTFKDLCKENKKYIYISDFHFSLQGVANTFCKEADDTYLSKHSILLLQYDHLKYCISSLLK